MSDDDKAEDASTEEESAEGEAAAQTPVAEEKPKGKLAGKLKYIIPATVILVLFGTLGGLYAFGVFHVEKGHETILALPGPPVYYEIPSMTVNLKPSDKRARPFIRLTLQVELQGDTAKQAFVAHQTKIVDQMQTHLRSIQFEDLEGTEGTERLREDFIIIINRIIQPELAITVLYKDIFMR